LEKYCDGLIVLGAQIGVKDGNIVPAFFTEMRARAAGIAHQLGICPRIILSGGYNIGVRYDIDLSVPVFGTASSDRCPDFGVEARVKARIYRSEASVMAEFITRHYKVPPEDMILEEESRSTEENALYCKGIAKRSGWKRIGLLTQLYHMERALGSFGKVGLEVIPLFAEDFLPMENNSWIDKICKYYSVPKGGKQWDIQKMSTLLRTRWRSVESLATFL